MLVISKFSSNINEVMQYIVVMNDGEFINYYK